MNTARTKESLRCNRFIRKPLYIGSNPDATAEQLSRRIRGHRLSPVRRKPEALGIRHAFREDEARHRARNSAQNLTTLRHVAWNLLKRAAHRKVGIAACRKRVGWDRDYLITLMTGANG